MGNCVAKTETFIIPDTDEYITVINNHARKTSIPEYMNIPRNGDRGIKTVMSEYPLPTYHQENVYTQADPIYSEVYGHTAYTNECYQSESGKFTIEKEKELSTNVSKFSEQVSTHAHNIPISSDTKPLKQSPTYEVEADSRSSNEELVSTNGNNRDDFEISNPSPVCIRGSGVKLVSSIDKRMLHINTENTCSDSNIYIHNPEFNQEYISHLEADTGQLNTVNINNVFIENYHIGHGKKYSDDPYCTLGIDGYAPESRKKHTAIKGHVAFRKNKKVLSSSGYLQTKKPVWETPPENILQEMKRITKKREYIKICLKKGSTYHKLESLNTEVVVPKDALETETEILLGKSSNQEDFPDIEDGFIESDVFHFLPHETRFKKRILIRFPLREKDRSDLNRLKLLYSNTDFNSKPNWKEVLPNTSEDGSFPVYFFTKTHCFLSLDNFCMYCVIGSTTNCPFEKSIPLTVSLYGLYTRATNVLQLITCFQDNLEKPPLPKISIGTLLDHISVSLMLNDTKLSYDVHTEDNWTILGYSEPRQDEIIQIPAMSTCPFVKYQLLLQPPGNQLNNRVTCKVSLKQGTNIIKTLYDASKKLSDLTEAGLNIQEPRESSMNQTPNEFEVLNQARNIPENNNNNIPVTALWRYFKTEHGHGDISGKEDEIIDLVCKKIKKNIWKKTFQQLNFGFTDNHVTPTIDPNLMLSFWIKLDGNSWGKLIHIFKQTDQDEAASVLSEHLFQGTDRPEPVGENLDSEDDTKVLSVACL